MTHAIWEITGSKEDITNLAKYMFPTQHEKLLNDGEYDESDVETVLHDEDGDDETLSSEVSIDDTELGVRFNDINPDWLFEIAETLSDKYPKISFKMEFVDHHERKGGIYNFNNPKGNTIYSPSQINTAYENITLDVATDKDIAIAKFFDNIGVWLGELVDNP